MDDVVALSIGVEGDIRISLGVASNCEDCYKFIQFCKELSDVRRYQKLLTAFPKERGEIQPSMSVELPVLEKRGTSSRDSSEGPCAQTPPLPAQSGFHGPRDVEE
jgi:hypothetical protein